MLYPLVGFHPTPQQLPASFMHMWVPGGRENSRKGPQACSEFCTSVLGQAFLPLVCAIGLFRMGMASPFSGGISEPSPSAHLCFRFPRSNRTLSQPFEWSLCGVRAPGTAPGLAEFAAPLLQAGMSAVALGHQLLRRDSGYITSRRGTSRGLMRMPARYNGSPQPRASRLSVCLSHGGTARCGGVLGWKW